MTMSAPVSARFAAISATLPRPANRAGSGFARFAVIVPVTVAPAELASACSSPRRSGSPPSPKSSSTNSARSPSGDDFKPSSRAAAKPAAGLGFAIVVVRGHRHRARGNDGRNGVLVDHLGDGVFQQHDVLIERFDLSLQLDAVDEVDRNLHVLLAQEIQERVL